MEKANFISVLRKSASELALKHHNPTQFLTFPFQVFIFVP